MNTLLFILSALGGSALGAVGATLMDRKRRASASGGAARVMGAPDVRAHAVRTSASIASPSAATRISRGRYAPKRRGKGAKSKESS